MVQAKKPLSGDESAKVIEAEIRKQLKNPTGEPTKADLENVETLILGGKQLTDVKGLEKLTQLVGVHLLNNSNLTRAQIEALQRALPK